ncbi:F0F1 ATP synthase subunit A [Kineococcus sp. SYSU DK006]|uniref:F0F1 ATP synthase subunit A n=1 Tax=Kineococcus sp. SYSU DK006 TaxID=3383127 RepID=UPI003D7C5803
MTVHALAAQTAEEGWHAPGAADFWQPLIGDGNWAITRSSIVFALLAVGLGLVLVAATRKLKVVPSKGQFLLESLYDFVRNGVGRDVIGSREFLKFVPLLFTMFVLILVNNVVGVIPPVQFPTMSRIGFPIALTLVVYITYHAVAVKRKGGLGYLKSLMPAGVPGWISPLVYVLELATYFVTRPFTLALRLFANMFAGHMLILVLVLGGEYLLLHTDGFLPVTGVVAFVFSIVMMFFELLIQVLQAYVFTLLTATYLADAVSNEH